MVVQPRLLEGVVKEKSLRKFDDIPVYKNIGGKGSISWLQYESYIKFCALARGLTAKPMEVMSTHIATCKTPASGVHSGSIFKQASISASNWSVPLITFEANARTVWQCSGRVCIQDSERDEGRRLAKPDCLKLATKAKVLCHSGHSFTPNFFVK